eukprot:33850-Eustigmatos_ZCMA.PRE.1
MILRSWGLNGCGALVVAACRYYGIKRTKFTDRVLTYLHKEGNSQLSFKEFVIVTWNYLSYSPRQIARVCFSFLDPDSRGLVSMVSDGAESCVSDERLLSLTQGH